MHLRLMRPRRGFTLIELLVVIGIIGILAAITFPVYSSAREKGRQATCINNQRQIAIAVNMYAQDHERYPGPNWTGELGINDRGIFECPSNPDPESRTSYGMNSYLHRTKADTISKPSDTVCTCDAVSSSVTGGDYTRHKKGAIFSRVDGSVKLAYNPAEAGRFATGQFPLQPVVVENGETVELEPDNFVENAGTTAVVTNEYLIAGPYGDGSDESCLKLSDLINHDYIQQNSFAQLNADAAPRVGDIAPKIGEITGPTSIDTPETAGEPINLFKKWTKIAADGGSFSLKSVGNYNCLFKYRTTYAVTYVYSPIAQSVTFQLNIDDGGIVWLNGARIAGYGEPNTGTDYVSSTTVTIPKGISYILVRDTNWEEGGAKFKLNFSGHTEPLKFSANLE